MTPNFDIPESFLSPLEILEVTAREYLEEELKAIKDHQDGGITGVAHINATYRYRQLAVVALTVRADQTGFVAFLCKSAALKLHLLEQWKSGAPIDPDAVKTSQNRSLADALVAGWSNAAVDLAKLSPQVLTPDLEYEEDFYLYHVLHQVLLKAGHHAYAPIAPIIDAWAALGSYDPHIDVCRALVDQDVTAFDTHMRTLIDERQAELEKLAQRRGPMNEFSLTERAIYFLGLTFIRLAELTGMQPEVELPMMPWLSRVPLISAEPPRDIWKSMNP